MEEEGVTLPAAAAVGQKPATEAVQDNVPEKTERTVTDTVQLAGTESSTGLKAEAASDTASASDNKVPE